MANDANAVVEGKLQQQLTAAQEKLLAEQQRRVDAEGEAKVRAAAVQCMKLLGEQCKPLVARAGVACVLPAAGLLPRACMPPHSYSGHSSPGLQVQQAKAQQAQREVERLQRSLSAREALIQQLKTQRANDTPAREVHKKGRIQSGVADAHAAIC